MTSMKIAVHALRRQHLMLDATNSPAITMVLTGIALEGTIQLRLDIKKPTSDVMKRHIVNVGLHVKTFGQQRNVRKKRRKEIVLSQKWQLNAVKLVVAETLKR